MTRANRTPADRVEAATDARCFRRLAIRMSVKRRPSPDRLDRGLAKVNAVACCQLAELSIERIVCPQLPGDPVFHTDCERRLEVTHPEYPGSRRDDAACRYSRSLSVLSMPFADAISTACASSCAMLRNCLSGKRDRSNSTSAAMRPDATRNVPRPSSPVSRHRSFELRSDTSMCRESRRIPSICRTVPDRRSSCSKRPRAISSLTSMRTPGSVSADSLESRAS